MGAAIHTSHPQCKLLSHMLASFHNLEMRTNYLTEVAYGWCSMVCESHSSLWNRKDLLLLALEIGFRHINPQSDWVWAELTHMESHQKMVEIVFQSGESEAIADLLYAWTSRGESHEPHSSLKICAQYIVGLSHLQPFSPRLHLVIIRSIVLLEYQGFEQVGVERLIGLLDGLDICIQDMSRYYQLGQLLLDIIQSPEGIQHVSHQYWELLVEFVVSTPHVVTGEFNPHLMTSLEDTEEWDKLECWMGFIWIMWSLGAEMDEDLETDEKLEHVTLSLFQQRPGAVQKLEQWVGRLYYHFRQQSKSFQQMFDEVYPNAAQQVAL